MSGKLIGIRNGLINLDPDSQHRECRKLTIEQAVNEILVKHPFLPVKNLVRGDYTVPLLYPGQGSILVH